VARDCDRAGAGDGTRAPDCDPARARSGIRALNASWRPLLAAAHCHLRLVSTLLLVADNNPPLPAPGGAEHKGGMALPFSRADHSSVLFQIRCFALATRQQRILKPTERSVAPDCYPARASAGPGRRIVIRRERGRASGRSMQVGARCSLLHIAICGSCPRCCSWRITIRHARRLEAQNTRGVWLFPSPGPILIRSIPNPLFCSRYNTTTDFETNGAFSGTGLLSGASERGTRAPDCDPARASSGASGCSRQVGARCSLLHIAICGSCPCFYSWRITIRHARRLEAQNTRGVWLFPSPGPITRPFYSKSVVLLSLQDNNGF